MDNLTAPVLIRSLNLLSHLRVSWFVIIKGVSWNEGFTQGVMAVLLSRARWLIMESLQAFWVSRTPWVLHEMFLQFADCVMLWWGRWKSFNIKASQNFEILMLEDGNIQCHCISQCEHVFQIVDFLRDKDYNRWRFQNWSVLWCFIVLASCFIVKPSKC